MKKSGKSAQFQSTYVIVDPDLRADTVPGR
jgi:hypothetical protein